MQAHRKLTEQSWSSAPFRAVSEKSGLAGHMAGEPVSVNLTPAHFSCGAHPIDHGPRRQSRFRDEQESATCHAPCNTVAAFW